MKKLCVIFCLIVFYAPKLFAISEEDYQKNYSNYVKPYYNSGEFGTFDGVDSIKIAYSKFEVANEKGAIVILHGKSESMIKYAEVIYDLKDLGYSMYLMDHRGMGFSERLLGDDKDKIYVQNFNDYIADVKTFVDTIVKAKPHKKMIVVAHSLGGAIAARYLEQYPDDFNGAVLSSPMLTINAQTYTQLEAYLIAAISTNHGHGTDYIPGGGPYTPETFVEDTDTHSYARYVMERDILNEYPQIRLGDVTYNWVKQAMELGWVAQFDARAITVPVLLFQAEDDMVVKPEGQDNLSKHAQDTTKIFFYGARHEILMEIDSIRDVAINYIRDFIEEL
jgi:lysophospholipase